MKQHEPQDDGMLEKKSEDHQASSSGDHEFTRFYGILWNLIEFNSSSSCWDIWTTEVDHVVEKPIPPFLFLFTSINQGIIFNDLIINDLITYK